MGVEPEEQAGVVSMKGVKISGRPVYLDMQATTPVDPRVLDAMLPFYLARFVNPHSRTYLYGWESESASRPPVPRRSPRRSSSPWAPPNLTTSPSRA